MEVIRGGQGDFGEEICGEVERRGARTAGGDDLRGQASGTVADEGAHPVEGGRVGGGRRLERQRDLRGVGHQHQQYRPHPASTSRRRHGGGADPQIQSELRLAADFRRGGGGEIDRPDLLAGARGVRALEFAPARGEGRRIEHRREGQRQHDRKDSKKNALIVFRVDTVRVRQRRRSREPGRHRRAWLRGFGANSGTWEGFRWRRRGSVASTL